MGYSVEENRPYEGALVPMEFYEKKDHRVTSIMVEVNRSLYMDESAGTKTSTFDIIREQIRSLLSSIREFHELHQPDARGDWCGHT
jgi:N-formylglutamate amidohydrolase